MSEENLPDAGSFQPATTESGAVMSTPETLGNIFFDPGATFESLRVKPRFLVAGLLILVISVGLAALFFTKINFTEFMRDQIENGPNASQLSPEQKEKAVKFWAGPAGKLIVYAGPFIGVIVVIAAGAGLYLLGTIALGGAMNYKQALAVWVYSSFPPAVLSGIVGVLVLLLKSADSIDPKHPEAIAQTNLGILLNPSTSPALYAVLSSLDLFRFYGLFLAAIGLKKVGRLSTGSAWTVVLALFILSVIFSVGKAALMGR